MEIKMIPVSVVMPMRNAATTVTYALRSLEKQKYPIKEVIVIDNASEDNSVKIVKRFFKKSFLSIRLIERDKNGGIGSSYNLGVKKVISELVILMHSDCLLPTANEIEKLTKPLRNDSFVLATFPTINLPMHVWNAYDFWEKCFFARQAGKGYAGPTSKFDCIRKSIYIKVGGFDTRNFGMGGEDMDLAQKICLLGNFVLSNAKATHLQYLGNDFTFKDFLRKKRQYAMIYGRLLRKRPKLFFGKSMILLLKPFLAISLFIPVINVFWLPIILLYSFIFTQKMFTTKSSLHNWRIIFVPFVNVFLIYYETFWIFASFLFGENAVS